MKIYNKHSFGKRRYFEYSGEITPESDGVHPIAITKKQIDIGDAIVIEGVAYTISAILHKNWCVVTRAEKQGVLVRGEEPEDQDYTEYITCPYCGYYNRDSWEMDDEEDEQSCGSCGGTFSYQRNVTIEYCSQPVKAPKVIHI